MKTSYSAVFDILNFCHFDMRKGFSVRWRTVIFVKMLTGFSLLSSYRFSLARFLIAWPLFSLVSTDRAAWHRLIYTESYHFGTGWQLRTVLVDIGQGGGVFLKKGCMYVLYLLLFCHRVSIFWQFVFHFFGQRKIQLYLQNKEFKTWRLVTVNSRYNPCFIQWMV